MGRKRKTGHQKKQFTLRMETLAALKEDYAAWGYLTYPDLSTFADAVLGIALGAERRRYIRCQQKSCRARELLYRQRDRAEGNYWRAKLEAQKLNRQFDAITEELNKHLPGTRIEVEALRSSNPFFRAMQDYADLYDELKELMGSDHKSVSITLRVLLKHLVAGVGTDTLPPAYARKVRAAYDRLADRRAVPAD